MIKPITTARNLPRELEEMTASRDFWRWGFWIALGFLCAALAYLLK